MLKQAVRLDQRFALTLKKFLIEQGRRNGLDYQEYLSSPIVIATWVNQSYFEQAFFVEISQGLAYTKLILGQYSTFTVELFNMLCATCASNDPSITDHRFSVASKDLYNFNELFKISRLGIFEKERSETVGEICVTVQYPDA